jgi:hypothetical protein
MEFDPGNSPVKPPEYTPDGKESKKSKRRRRRAGFSAPLPLAEQSDHQLGRPKAASETLSELFRKKKPEKSIAPTEVKDDRSDKDKEAAAEGADSDEYVAFERQEQPADMLYMGELLIPHDDEQVEKTAVTIPLSEDDQPASDESEPSVELPASPSRPAAETEAPAESTAPTEMVTKAAEPEPETSGGQPPIKPTETPPPAISPAAMPPERTPQPVFTIPARETDVPSEIREALAREQSVLAAPQPMVTPEQHRAAIADAEYYAEKRGQNHGVAAGMLAGGLYEHFKHKRQGKKQVRQLAEQQKHIESLEADQAVLRREQAAHPSEAVQQNQLERSGRQAGELPPFWTPQASEAAPKLSAVEAAARPSHETILSTEAKRFETPHPEVAQPAPVAESAPSEQVALPPDRRVETSAWHRIEIDAKTGKLVEKPTLEYGEEYYHERSHETEPADDDVQVAAGEVALVAAALNDDQKGGASGTTTPGSLPDIPSASTKQKVGTPQLTQKGTPAAPNAARHSSGGPLWPYVVAFVVVVILLIAALR